VITFRPSIVENPRRSLAITEYQTRRIQGLELNRSTVQEVSMKKLFFGFSLIYLLVSLSACAPVTLVRADIASDFTSSNVAASGIAAAPIQGYKFLGIVNQNQRANIDLRLEQALRNLFGSRSLGGQGSLSSVKQKNIDGEFLAALNEYDLRGTMRTDSFDQALETMDFRYLVLPRLQYAESKIGSQWLFFPTVESKATLDLAIYDRQNRRVVTDIITNGFATKGFFGGGLIDAALDQSLNTALSVLKSRVR
jgi:hypothetical protein